MLYSIKNFIAHKFLLRELVIKGIKLKYRRSYLGILWSLLEPVLMTAVLTVIFGTLFNNNNPLFPLHILSGRLLYSFFSSATNMSLRAIRSNASMIKKVYVPKYLYVLSSIIYNYLIFLVSLVVLFGLAIILKVYPTWNLLLAWLPLVLLFLLAFGVGMILATIGVFFRDMEYLWSIIMTVIMYASAIFYYPEKILSSQYWWILKYNPLFQIIDMFRKCIMGQTMSMFSLLYASGFTLVTIIVGCAFFIRKQDKFILYI
ncbi:MAG: ABC transporter permease [Lachnospiraceae bacterium]|nr:ABC transporter permease [Lachnospiraceae bacterium]